MTARLYPFPTSRFATQRVLAALDSALVTLEIDRSETLAAIDRIERILASRREDLAGLEGDRRVLEGERAAILVRLDAEAAS